MSLCQLTAINNGTYPIAKVLLREQGGILIIVCPQDTLHNSDSIHVANRTS